MKTVYLLQGTRECSEFLTHYKNNPTGNINIIIVPKSKPIKDKRIKSYPFVINGVPSSNGLPPMGSNLRKLRLIKYPKVKPKTPVKPKTLIKPKTPVKPLKISIKKIKTNDGHMLILKKK